VSIIENIHGHEDLAALSEGQRAALCGEIREYLVSSVAKTGGHLASNLGAVELTVALETVFNTMRDRLVFDVGHQSYVHKLLTGRQADFAHLRQYGGISGFPKPHESAADSFVAGHASSSVSIALGMARARTLMGEDYHVIALLGDGAATGGMVFEGMNDAAESGEPMIIILNDNEMSIDKNVGGVARHLYRLRMKEQYLGLKSHYRRLMNRIPGGRTLYRVSKRFKDRVKRFLLPTTIFENMGLAYLGPVDGHDLPGLIAVLKIARDMACPVVVHVVTKKGFGYKPAEQSPSKFHGIGKFDPATGETLKKSSPTFSDSFGETMVELAKSNDRVCAITAAMPGGTGLLDFKKQFPNRLFDVGIAEEHAVSMAGGLAKQGMIPVVALYSTFLQRSYDQIMQDTALLGLHVVFAIDRAGLVGEDGATHHGVFDVGFLRQIPGMTVLAPGSRLEQQQMLRWAVENAQGPIAIRYPRGGDCGYNQSAWDGGSAVEYGLVTCHRQGKDITIITYGTLLDNAMRAAEILSEKGVEVTVLRLLTLFKLPVQKILDLAGGKKLLVVEEVSGGCGIAQALSLEVMKDSPEYRVFSRDLGADFVPHGSMEQLYKHCGLDAQALADYAEEVLRDEN
jgi:1-deoxy-D-xylulose-5-phosphate synthase